MMDEDEYTSREMGCLNSVGGLAVLALAKSAAFLYVENYPKSENDAIHKTPDRIVTERSQLNQRESELVVPSHRGGKSESLNGGRGRRWGWISDIRTLMLSKSGGAPQGRSRPVPHLS